MRGRKPKPLSLQKSEGDTRKRGARKLAAAIKAEPRSLGEVGPAPEYLTDEERMEYEGIRDDLEALRLLDKADGRVMALAAIACATAQRGRTGQALRTALTYLSSLGLAGASSRARLAVEKPSDGAEELAAILSRPRERKAPIVQ